MSIGSAEFTESENVSEISFESKVRMVAFRLRPGQDLKAGIEAVIVERKLQAAAVVACVGSLRTATLRFAGRDSGTVLEGPFEICSLSGLLSSGAGTHLHVSLSDFDGKMLGGHLMLGCQVHTTAEVVLAELEEAQFERASDQGTGYRELYIQRR
jgi:predicted DNA-binding protein with PD1-like motif